MAGREITFPLNRAKQQYFVINAFLNPRLTAKYFLEVERPEAGVCSVCNNGRRLACNHLGSALRKRALGELEPPRVYASLPRALNLRRAFSA